ncbi:MAG: hypothetical protein ACR2G2_16455 [Pseudonocardia sp.]
MQRTWVLAPVAVVTVLAAQLGPPVPGPTRVAAPRSAAMEATVEAALAAANEAAGWQCALPHRPSAQRTLRSDRAALVFTEPSEPTDPGAASTDTSAKPIAGFGTGPGQNPRVRVTGTLARADSADTFAVPLRAGEVFSATVRGAGGTLEVRDPEGTLVEGSGIDRSGSYPSSSPLLGGGNATVDHVAAVTGTHTITIRPAKSGSSGASGSAGSAGDAVAPAPSAAAPGPAAAPAPDAPEAAAAPAPDAPETAATAPSSPNPPAEGTTGTAGTTGAAGVTGTTGGPSTSSTAKPAPAGRSYQVDLGIFRPTAATQQKIVLEFTGATIDTRRFGLETANNQAKLSPLSAFLTGFGLTAADQPALIARITDTVRENVSEALGGGTVDVTSADQPGSSSFGKPGVSRVVIGGSAKEAGIATVGLAESVDPGNFAKEETALVLLDRLSGAVANPAALSHYLPANVDKKTRVEFVGRAVGNIASHETGHLLGSWHTDAASGKHDLMAPGDVVGAFGFGADKIGGTSDDVRSRFAQDTFAPQEGFTGTEDTHNRTVVGLRGSPNPD